MTTSLHEGVLAKLHVRDLDPALMNATLLRTITVVTAATVVVLPRNRAKPKPKQILSLT